MTKSLKIGFIDTLEPIAQFFIEALTRKFDVERDDQNPNYLIFGDRNFGQQNLKPQYQNCTRIFYTGENQRAAHYNCHHAITFDHMDTPEHYRLPLYVIYDWDNRRKGIANINDCERSFGDLLEQRQFCSFIVKNPSCQMRNDFFLKMNKYKKVDAAGPWMNNVGYLLDGGENACQAKLDFLPKYKFNICFENASYPGYATEKLYEALIGRTVPIYWGSPTIDCDFNTKAFLNWHDYLDSDRLLDKVIELDNDPEYYTEMYLEPMFHNFKDNKYFDLDRFVEWFEKNVYKG